MLDKHAHDLAVADIDVVRPLDAGVDAVSGKHLDKGQGYDLRDGELLARGKKRRLQNEREGHVAAGGTLPDMAPLTAAGGLEFGPHDIALAVTRVTGVVVARRGAFNVMYHLQKAVIMPKRRNRAGRR